MNKNIIIILTLFLIFFTGCSSTVAVVGNDQLINNGTTQVTEDYIYAVAAGQVNSATVWNKWGYNNDVDVSSSPEIIATFGGDLTILTVGTTLNISSTDANDVLNGSGANFVLITGVDENRVRVEELVALNGLNTVTTTNQFLGVNRMVVYLGGNNFRNDGDITAIASTGGSIQAVIPTGHGTTQQAFLFTETNHTFLANWMLINANKLAGGTAPKIKFKAVVRSFVSQSEYEVFELVMDTAVENSLELNPNIPFVVGEKSVLYFTAETDTNNAIASIRFSGIEKHNQEE